MVATNPGATQGGNTSHLQHGVGSSESNVLMGVQMIGVSPQAKNYDPPKGTPPT